MQGLAFRLRFRHNIPMRMFNREGSATPESGPWTRLLLCSALCCLCFAFAGCGKIADVDQAGAHQSLVEIGERSLEVAETKEMDGRMAEANASYRRALWAFTYHEHLTGEEPLLMEEAQDGVRRTNHKD